MLFLVVSAGFNTNLAFADLSDWARQLQEEKLSQKEGRDLSDWAKDMQKGQLEYQNILPTTANNGTNESYDTDISLPSLSEEAAQEFGLEESDYVETKPDALECTQLEKLMEESECFMENFMDKMVDAIREEEEN